MEQTTRTENVARRARKAKRLADKLFFKLDRQGSRYSLRRTTGVSSTVRRENLSEELRDYRILPLLARMRPGFALRLNHDEADDAFEVPLALLMAPENHKRESRDWNGFTLSLYAMQFGGCNIWGATAGIVRNL